MATFDAGSWVWITDEQECYLPARVIVPFKPGEEGRVQTEDGEVCAACHCVYLCELCGFGVAWLG